MRLEIVLSVHPSSSRGLQGRGIATKRAEGISLQNRTSLATPRTDAPVRHEAAFGIASAGGADRRIIFVNAAHPARSRRRVTTPLMLKPRRQHRHSIDPAPVRTA